MARLELRRRRHLMFFAGLTFLMLWRRRLDGHERFPLAKVNLYRSIDRGSRRFPPLPKADLPPDRISQRLRRIRSLMVCQKTAAPKKPITSRIAITVCIKPKFGASEATTTL